MIKIIISIIFITTLVGCATKHYGRLGTVSEYEKSSLSCKEINLEIAKVNGFKDRVNKESAFSGADVLAVLGDLGIGNAMETDAAHESADSRLNDLYIY